VTFPGLLDVLDDAYERFTRGEAVRRSWFASTREWYSTRSDGPEAEGPSVEWLKFDHPVPGRFIRSVTETLRRATLELYDRLVASAPGEVPAVLHGHGFTGSGYQHGHWLALPDVGHRYATGRLFGAAVWIPPGTDPSVEAGVQAALVHLHELVLPGGRRIGVSLFDGAARPIAATPARWTGPTRHWVSALPVVHEHWGPVTAEEVSRWCRHAGLPEPVAFRSATVPLIEGALSLRALEVHRAGGERRPYSHLEVWFAEPVTGPVMIGRARQFGLGLMCPANRGR
jgi:CRISPR-associated protein Csb2